MMFGDLQDGFYLNHEEVDTLVSDGCVTWECPSWIEIDNNGTYHKDGTPLPGDGLADMFGRPGDIKCVQEEYRCYTPAYEPRTWWQWLTNSELQLSSPPTERHYFFGCASVWEGRVIFVEYKSGCSPDRQSINRWYEGGFPMPTQWARYWVEIENTSLVSVEGEIKHRVQLVRHVKE